MNKTNKELVIVNGSSKTAEVIAKGNHENCLVISEMYVDKIGALKLYILVSNTMGEKDAMQLLNNFSKNIEEKKFMAWIPVNSLHNLSTTNNLNLTETNAQLVFLFATKALGLDSILLEGLRNSVGNNNNKEFGGMIKSACKDLVVSTNSRIH